MRRKRLIEIAVVTIVLAVLFALTLPLDSKRKEPSYNGHSLSYWVAVLGKPTTPTTEREQATNAVVHIDVAALPFLVKWIQFDPPRWKRTLASGLARTRFAPANQLARRIIDPTLANGTEFAFAILGPRAMPAFDDLCRLMNDTNRQKAIPAARALPALGPTLCPRCLRL